MSSSTCALCNRDRECLARGIDAAEYHICHECWRAIPYANRTWTSYENFEAQCPRCEQKSTFNRATDLKDLNPIDFRTVFCLNAGCRKPFNINNDSINPRHQMLVLDCSELLERKRYMNCILNVAQAYEMFFGLFLRVQLLYKPWARDTERDSAHLNRLADKLRDKIKEYTFARMRALFLRQLIADPKPANLTEAETAVASLDPSEPKDAEIEALADKNLVALLKRVKRTGINTLRNQVVHKEAYRPPRKEAEEALDEARLLLFQLTRRLDLADDINHYRRQK